MKYGSISLAAGLVLLLWSELAGLASLRIAAAALMVVGAAGLGIAAGRKQQSPEMLNRIGGLFSRPAACVAAVILVAPVLSVLAAVLAGAAEQLLDSGSAAKIQLGAAAVGSLLLMLTIAALVVAMVAIRAKAVLQSGEKGT